MFFVIRIAIMAGIGTAGMEGQSAEDTSGMSIPKGTQSDHVQKRTFTKVHRLLTYGLATKLIKEGAATDDVRTLWATTHMANIPWDRLHFYMTDAEYQLLPVDTIVKNCKITVRMEAPRTAFESNASTTTLATIHQNKFLRRAVGLLQTGLGRNKKITFGTGDAMIPTGVTEYKDTDYTNQKEAMYGNSNTYAQTAYIVPRVFFGIPYPLDSYFCADIPQNIYDGNGWADIESHIMTDPADNSVGSEIMSVQYTPECAPIKFGSAKYGDSPVACWTGGYKALVDRYPLLAKIGATTAAADSIYVPGGDGQHQVISRKFAREYDNTTTTARQANGYLGQILQTAFRDWKSYIPVTSAPSAVNSVIQEIEKCQWVKRGIHDVHKVKTQPSVHIGIQSIEALSTTVQLNPAVDPTQYTDVQGYFIVHAELETESIFPTHRPYLGNSVGNCRPDQQFFFDETQFGLTTLNDSAYFAGLKSNKI